MFLAYSRFSEKSGLITSWVISTFSKITFNKGISKVKFNNPNTTASIAKTAYFGTKRLYGLAKASILKYIFIAIRAAI
jgi:hypothetical protein